MKESAIQSRAPGKPARKSWTLAHEGLRATIRYEPRKNRRPYRVEWVEEGQERSEMFETLDIAQTNAWAKLKALACGDRTLTRTELAHLLAFRRQYETLQEDLKTTGRSVDLTISDLVVGCDMLPGWRPTQMAEFLVENHEVKHPTKVRRVAEKFMRYRRSGKERDYDRDTLSYDEFRLRDFCRVYGEVQIHCLRGREILAYIMAYKVGPPGGKRPAGFDPKSLRPASQSTKRVLFGLFNCVFNFAKKKLHALRPHADTVLERLDPPECESAPLRIYLPDQTDALFKAQVDVESMLFVGMQAYAALEEVQARRVRSEDIVLRSPGVEPHIIIREKTGWKDPVTGEVRIRTHLAPITRPLEALLAKIKLPPGNIIRSKSIKYKTRRAAREAGLPWIHGGLRCSFIAYRLAAGHNLGQVAYEAGYAFERDIQRFVGLAEASDATAYWRIRIQPGRREYTAGTIRWKASKASPNHSSKPVPSREYQHQV